jgi:hypothetical protein
LSFYFISEMATDMEKPQTNGIDANADDELNHSRPADIEAVSILLIYKIDIFYLLSIEKFYR